MFLLVLRADLQSIGGLYVRQHCSLVVYVAACSEQLTKSTCVLLLYIHIHVHVRQLCVELSSLGEVKCGM